MRVRRPSHNGRHVNKWSSSTTTSYCGMGTEKHLLYYSLTSLIHGVFDCFHYYHYYYYYYYLWWRSTCAWFSYTGSTDTDDECVYSFIHRQIVSVITLYLLLNVTMCRHNVHATSWRNLMSHEWRCIEWRRINHLLSNDIALSNDVTDSMTSLIRWRHAAVSPFFNCFPLYLPAEG